MMVDDRYDRWDLLMSDLLVNINWAERRTILTIGQIWA